LLHSGNSSEEEKTTEKSQKKRKIINLNFSQNPLRSGISEKSKNQKKKITESLKEPIQEDENLNKKNKKKRKKVNEPNVSDENNEEVSEEENPEDLTEFYLVKEENGKIKSKIKIEKL
jgi:hypothetical protein